ncbi:ATP dependent DNA ligase domain-containing protein [Phlyctochytrium arcticum]|nr:ATP dependent DNA ligase domain-containing protein [Phlyctochytrium arcticum]
MDEEAESHVPGQEVDIASRASFHDLCRCLQAVLRIPGNGAKKERMKQYIEEWRSTGGDFFPAMRLILPHLDKSRSSYGMKDKVLAKTYVEALGLAPHAPDAESLINWRNPGKAGSAAAGDFPGVLHNIIKNRAPVLGRSNVTIADINNKLDDLNVATEKSERREIIRYLFSNCSPLEQMWAARMILKDLKLGISENSVFSIWHPDAMDQFNVTSDLAKLCRELRDPTERVMFKQISLFNPFKPMSAKTVREISEIPGYMGNKPFWVETKLDGERTQMHMNKGQYQWYSRHGTNYTPDYGKDKYAGSLVPYIYDQFDSKVESVILDGELLAFNTESGVYEPFGSLRSASTEVREKGTAAKLHPCFVVFDVVLLNGRNIADQSLRDRRQYLQRIIREKETYIEILPHEEIKTAEEVMTHLGQRIEQSEEGLIVKDPSSVYMPGVRGTHWCKVKAEYIDSMGDDVDLLIVGGYYGEGRRRGRLSHFMCAIMEDPQVGEGPSRLISFCKVGTGYKIKEMDELSRYREGHWRPYDPKRPPSWFIHPANSKEKPDMILSPEYGRVIQVRSSEVTKTDTYGAGWTLRFPRFIKVREDKGLDGVMTVSQLHDYIRHSSERKANLLSGVNMEMKEKKRKKAVARRIATATAWRVANSCLGVDKTQITKTDDLFHGKEFCVVPNATEGGFRDKHVLETTILEHGGTCVQNPVTSTNMIIADLWTLKVNNYKAAGVHDIVKSRYISDCIKENTLLPLNPKYMLFATEGTKESFKESIDMWGDSYTNEIKTSGLKELFNSMDMSALEGRRKKRALDVAGNGREPNRHDTIAEIEERYFSLAPHEGSLFRRIKIYIDLFEKVRVTAAFVGGVPDLSSTGPLETDGCSSPTGPVPGSVLAEHDSPNVPEHIPDSSLDIIECKLRARGAEIHNAITPWTTHIVVDASDYQSVSNIVQRVRVLRSLISLRSGIEAPSASPMVRLVTQAWVNEAIELGRLPDERIYEPVVIGTGKDELHVGGVAMRQSKPAREPMP